MKSVEKEIRYLIDDNILEKIIDISSISENKVHMLDITCGKEGFDSLEKFGYICRIRQKENKIIMEVKKRENNGVFIESKINIKTVKDGLDFFSLLSMKPYLYIDRKREVRKYKGLKLFIDEIDMLGKFVEIEYQDVDEAKLLLEEFKEQVGIVDIPQPLYGDIFKDKIENDKYFKKEFELKLNVILR